MIPRNKMTPGIAKCKNKSPFSQVRKDLIEGARKSVGKEIPSNATNMIVDAIKKTEHDAHSMTPEEFRNRNV